MLDFNHLGNLEEIANKLKNLLEYCEISDRLDIVDAYAKVCTAISKVHADYQSFFTQDQQFLQIGGHIIRKADIIRVEIEEPNERYNNPKMLRIIMRDIDGSEVSSSWNKQISFKHDSKEAALFLYWLSDQTERLGTEEKVSAIE